MALTGICSNLYLSSLIFDPRVLRRLIMVSTSLTIGIFVRVTFLSVNIVEARIGSVAFFDPEIFMLPEIFLPPLISNFCIILELYFR